MIELRLLGQIRLVGGDGADVESVLRQPKRLALLAYLASPSPGTWHRRDVLLALFWPELDTPHARTSLRTALYVLRQSLGDQVIRTRGDDEISIEPDALKTDLAIVWDALRNGRIDEALQEYRGELMPGLYPPDSDGFQRWLDAERARLKTSITVSSIQWVTELEKSERHKEALAVARRIIEIEPDDETLVRRVMSLHDSIGDKAGALNVFENYKSRLKSDFDAEPALETIAIANRMRGTTPAAPRVKTVPVQRAPTAIADEKQPPIEVRLAPKRSLRTLAGIAALAAFAIIAWASSRPEHPMVVGNSGPVTSDEGLQVHAAISPNGRLVAYAKGNTSELRIFVQRIGGGPARPLTVDSADAEISPRWAPDNDQILFLSHAGAYVSPSIGGSPRLVARGTPGDGMVRSAAWSPTGDSIAIVRNDSLIVQPLQAPGSRYVGSGKQLHSCVWSPVGSRIACVSGNWVAFEPGPLFGNEAPSEIVVFSSSGGAPVDVTGAEFQNRSPAWSNDGRFLWMISDRGGAPGEVFSVPIGKDGHPSGPFARAGITAESIDLSANVIAYSVPVRRANIWSVPVPGAKLLTLADAKPLTSGTHLIETLSVSNDGKWLVYDSNVYGNADIFRMPISGGPEERLTDDPKPEYMGALSPDNRDLALHRWSDGKRRVIVKHLETGAEQEVAATDSGDQGGPRWSPDGQSLGVWKHDNEQGATFVAHRDASGKWQRPTWKVTGAQLPVWSSDGRMLALVRYDGGIDVMPSDSGARRRVYTRRPGTSDPIASNLVWNIDPATIWFLGSDERGHGGIWSVATAGGSPRLRIRLDDPAGRLHGPLVASDKQAFYFTMDERFSNVRWAKLTRP
jgi:Tol biopolymer transport system component/DNA-binding SARP family transcriptional activator